jgi:hypothetical protein
MKHGHPGIINRAHPKTAGTVSHGARAAEESVHLPASRHRTRWGEAVPAPRADQRRSMRHEPLEEAFNSWKLGDGKVWVPPATCPARSWTRATRVCVHLYRPGGVGRVRYGSWSGKIPLAGFGSRLHAEFVRTHSR